MNAKNKDSENIVLIGNSGISVNVGIIRNCGINGNAEIAVD